MTRIYPALGLVEAFEKSLRHVLYKAACIDTSAHGCDMERGEGVLAAANELLEPVLQLHGTAISTCKHRYIAKKNPINHLLQR